MSVAERSRKLRVPANRITEILNSQRPLRGIRPCRLVNSPEFWLNLQSIYNLRVAEQKSGDAIKSLPTLPHRGKRNRDREHLRSA